MAAELDTIEIKKETLGNILKNGGKLFVPVNQRSYRWEEDHIKDLYQDLGQAIDSERTEYFLGSVVVVVKDAGRIEVNDGQQRIATTMVLVAAIRDYFLSVGATNVAASVEQEYLFSPDRKTQELIPKFHLNTDDHQYLIENIVQRPDLQKPKPKGKEKFLKESHARLALAKQLAAEHVANIVAGLALGEAQANKLHRWLDFLDQGARVIWVEVTRERTAYIIFETMNDRGLKLSAADLLKNYIYGKADDRLSEAIQKWQTMRGTLETLGDAESGIVEFIRYLWVSKYGHIRTRDLYDSIKEKIINKTAALTWVSELESRSRDYAALLTPTHEMWPAYGPEVRKQIDTLSFIGVTQLRSILLAALPKFTHGEFSKLLESCIAWSVRFLISTVPSGTLEGYYSKTALKITNGEITDVAKVTNEMLPILPDDEKFEASFATASVAHSRLSRYYLRALQLRKDNVPEPQYIPNDGKVITLEHILPENPDKVDWSYIAPDEAKANWKRLGNQVLLQGSANSKLGNIAYNLKRPTLAASEFSLTREASTPAQWDIPAIIARQKELAKLALVTWPI